MPITWGPDSIVTDGLVLYVDAANPRSYPGTGSTWYDLSPNRYDFTLYNNPTYEPEGFFVANGTNQYARSNKTVDLTTCSAITVFSIFQYLTSSVSLVYEHTANWNSNNNYSSPIGTISYGGFGLGSNTDGNNPAINQCHFQLKGNSSYAKRNILNNSLSTLESYHVIHNFNFSGGSQPETYVYVNGVSGVTTVVDTSNNTSVFGNDHMYFWSRGGTSLYAALRFKCFAIYNRMLSQSEISQNHRSFSRRYNL